MIAALESNERQSDQPINESLTDTGNDCGTIIDESNTVCYILAI